MPVNQEVSTPVLSVTLVLKLIGVTLSAVLGIVGLLGESINRRSHRLTMLGKISLSGIVLGALLSVGSEIADTLDKLRDAKEMNVKLEGLSAKSDDLIKDQKGLISDQKDVIGQNSRLLKSVEENVSSSKHIMGSTEAALLGTEKLLNPIEGRFAMHYQLVLPWRGREDGKAYLLSAISNYMAQITAAKDSGKPFDRSDTQGIPETGWLKNPFYSMHGITWSLYQPKNHVYLQVDEQNRPALITYSNDSEIAANSIGGKIGQTPFKIRVWTKFDKYTRLGPCGVQTEIGPVNQPPDLALEISHHPNVPAPDPLERWRESVDPLRITNSWNVRRDGFVQSGSVRLGPSEYGDSGLVGSPLDLKGATVVIEVPHGARFCSAQLYAGRYMVPIKAGNLVADECGDTDFYHFVPDELVDMATNVTMVQSPPYLSYCDELLGIKGSINDLADRALPNHADRPDTFLKDRPQP